MMSTAVKSGATLWAASASVKFDGVSDLDADRILQEIGPDVSRHQRAGDRATLAVELDDIDQEIGAGPRIGEEVRDRRSNLHLVEVRAEPTNTSY